MAYLSNNSLNKLSLWILLLFSHFKNKERMFITFLLKQVYYYFLGWQQKIEIGNVMLQNISILFRYYTDNRVKKFPRDLNTNITEIFPQMLLWIIFYSEKIQVSFAFQRNWFIYEEIQFKSIISHFYDDFYTERFEIYKHIMCHYIILKL